VTPIIDVSHVSRSFGRVQALDDVSLQVRAGEIYGLIGPNGSGKTTLIRVVMGLLPPDEGEVRVFDRRVPSRRACAQMGYMIQGDALYHGLTVRENLEFFAAIYGVPARLRRDRIEEALALVGLAGRAGDLVENLSGGMRQRTSLASTLLHRPRLLLLDEPTVGVDPELRLAFWDHFRGLAGGGTTVVVSTHHLDEAARCDRLGLLREGRILADGSPAEIVAAADAPDMESAFLHFAGVRQ